VRGDGRRGNSIHPPLSPWSNCSALFQHGGRCWSHGSWKAPAGSPGKLSGTSPGPAGCEQSLGMPLCKGWLKYHLYIAHLTVISDSGVHCSWNFWYSCTEQAKKWGGLHPELHSVVTDTYTPLDWGTRQHLE